MSALSVVIDKTPHLVRRCAEAAAMVPATEGDEGPIFKVKHLDYYQVQAVYAADDVGKQTRLAFEAGLVAIDGDTKAVAEFLAAPSALYAGALWRYLWDHALGN